MPRADFVIPPKPRPGDRVAILSPSFAAPGLFPEVHELAMRRLRDELGLVPVEYPTTRRVGASATDRAADVMAAFEDDQIAVLMATIGGDDQITVLPHLDPDRVRSNPKPFFGYSDNTNLLNWLWNLGIVGYHGGSTMVHLGRGASIHPVSLASLKRALFAADEVEITPIDEFSEDEVSWDSPSAVATPPSARPADGWTWRNPDRTVSGPTWGGNLEVLHWNLAAGRWIRPAEEYDGCVLMIETSEEMPSGTEVYRMLRNVGERGLLARFPAAVVGRPKRSSRARRPSEEERTRYAVEQRDAVERAFAEYHASAMLVFDVDMGHTDPQWILPYGGTMRIDGLARTIHARY